jgi:hypothetical protein
MLSLEMPEFQFRAVDLEPRAAGSNKKGPRDRGPRPDRLSGRLLLGTPVAIPLTAAAAGDDKETVEFLKARAAQSDFYLVTMACSFQPKEEEPFEQAWLYVHLDRSDGAKDPRPTAYSMRPLKTSREIQQSNSIKLGADFKLMGVGFETGGGRDEKTTREDVLVQGFNELSPEPFWQFNARDGAPLDGSYRMALVVEAPKSVGARVAVNLEATVRHTFLKLIPYRSSFDGRESISINLP